MISPLSQGLFSKAISHSGSINSRGNPARSTEALQATYNLAGYFNCPVTDTKLAVDCLRNVSARDLVEFSQAAGFSQKIVIEDFASDEAPFLTTRVYNMNSINIPWIVGINSEEGVSTAYGLSSK